MQVQSTLPDPSTRYNMYDPLSSCGSTREEDLSNPRRRQDWENGQIDYLGIDSFDNIQRTLDARISSGDGSAGRAHKPGPASSNVTTSQGKNMYGQTKDSRQALHFFS